tara:strand:+ start:3911 stop:4216 length:306 start_codon:yes stop_codon:yes gene_type:complete
MRELGRVAWNDPWYDPELHGPKRHLPYRLFGKVFWQGWKHPILWDRKNKPRQNDKFGMDFNTIKQETDWERAWLTGPMGDQSEEYAAKLDKATAARDKRLR